ncbi:hypothetical protein ADUPG1_002719 [Aduncisulcus paluster]|uniref:Uncharacterized protein n=1 Tax=Aduncisulcus paluster TaxID=2918883 RepID=A0ABQ5KN92_9EUKA|nr:hypothetical protein ADUPG1_002719 [Aduncisulcus paluster]
MFTRTKGVAIARTGDVSEIVDTGQPRGGRDPVRRFGYRHCTHLTELGRYHRRSEKSKSCDRCYRQSLSPPVSLADDVRLDITSAGVRFV